MKKNIFYLAGFLLLLIPFLQSCDDDGYPIDNYLITMATVERSTTGSTPYFVWDNNKAVNIAATLIPFTNLATGQRVLGDFTLLTDRDDSFAHDVRLNDYRTVLTKNIIDLTEENERAIGNDPVSINEMWIGNDYLNVIFTMVVPTEEKHLVNLVYNTINEPDESDGYIHLEYRYNNMGDTAGYRLKSIVSFKLGYFDGSNLPVPKGIKVKINSSTNGERIITLENPKYDDAMNRSFSEDLNSEEIN